MLQAVFNVVSPVPSMSAFTRLWSQCGQRKYNAVSKSLLVPQVNIFIGASSHSLMSLHRAKSLRQPVSS